MPYPNVVAVTLQQLVPASTVATNDYEGPLSHKDRTQSISDENNRALPLKIRQNSAYIVM